MRNIFACLLGLAAMPALAVNVMALPDVSNPSIWVGIEGPLERVEGVVYAPAGVRVIACTDPEMAFCAATVPAQRLDMTKFAADVGAGRAQLQDLLRRAKKTPNLVLVKQGDRLILKAAEE